MDDYTRTVFTRLLHLKSEAVEAFKVFRAAAENDSGKRIQEIMMNNMHKLSMAEMRDISKSDSIKLHTTVLFHPASNGMAEQMIRVLTNAVRAMSTQACQNPFGHKLPAQQHTFAIGPRQRLWMDIPFTKCCMA